jgi:hypothetical protein
VNVPVDKFIAVPPDDTNVAAYVIMPVVFMLLLRLTSKYTRGCNLAAIKAFTCVSVNPAGPGATGAGATGVISLIVFMIFSDDHMMLAAAGFESSITIPELVILPLLLNSNSLSGKPVLVGPLAAVNGTRRTVIKYHKMVNKTI